MYWNQSGIKRASKEHKYSRTCSTGPERKLVLKSVLKTRGLPFALPNICNFWFHLRKRDGRAGTLVCALALLNQLRTSPLHIDVFGTVLVLSRYRPELLKNKVGSRVSGGKFWSETLELWNGYCFFKLFFNRPNCSFSTVSSNMQLKRSGLYQAPLMQTRTEFQGVSYPKPPLQIVHFHGYYQLYKLQNTSSR